MSPPGSTAVLIGITEYEDPAFGPLPCARADVEELTLRLETHRDSSLNFDTTPIIVSNQMRWSAGDMLRAVNRDLDESEHFLFYFSGHGAVDEFGLQLVTPEKSDPQDSGVYFDALLHRFNKSAVPEITVILDCCFSGAGGDRSYERAGQTLQFAHVREGVTILASSRRHEESEGADDGPSIFTRELLDCIDTGATNVLDLYNVARGRLGSQTPVLRTFGTVHSPLRLDASAIRF